VLAAGGAAAIPLTGAGAQSPGPRTITLVEHNKGSSFGFADNTPRNKSRRRPVLSPGDMVVSSMPVFDATNRSGVGRRHGAYAGAAPVAPFARRPPAPAPTTPSPCSAEARAPHEEVKVKNTTGLHPTTISQIGKKGL
jgi:hypothetical protein